MQFAICGQQLPAPRFDDPDIDARMTALRVSAELLIRQIDKALETRSRYPDHDDDIESTQRSVGGDLWRSSRGMLRYHAAGRILSVR